MTPQVPGQGGAIRTDAQAHNWGSGGLRNLQVWDNDFDEVKSVVMAMKPNDVDAAGTAFKDVATRIYESIELIYREAGRLADNWGGDDAVAAMKQLQKAYDAAYEIYSKSHTTGYALAGHATMQRSWQERMANAEAPTSGGVGGVVRTVATVASPITGIVGGGAVDNEAGHRLKVELQNQTVTSNSRFPESIQATMPNPYVTPYQPPPRTDLGGGPGNVPTSGTGTGPGFGSGTLPGSGPAPGELPSGTGPGPNGYPGPGTGTGNLPAGYGPPGGLGSGGGLGGGGLGGGSDLAGLGPGGGGGGVPGGLGGGGGGVPGGGALGSAGPGAGLGPGGVPGGVPGGGLGKNGAGMGGMGGMPMGGGGGGGRNDEERERTTWLTEDEDVWGGNDDTAPPVIG